MKYLEIGLKSMLWTIAIGLVVGALFAMLAVLSLSPIAVYATASRRIRTPSAPA